MRRGVFVEGCLSFILGEVGGVWGRGELGGGVFSPVAVDEGRVRRAWCRVVSGFALSHFNHPPRPLPAWSLTTLLVHPARLSPRVTRSERFRRRLSAPSHLKGEIQKVNPRPLSASPMRMEWGSVSTQRASSPRTSERTSETSSARRMMSMMWEGSRFSPAKAWGRVTPSIHSLTR